MVGAAFLISCSGLKTCNINVRSSMHLGVFIAEFVLLAVAHSCFLPCMLGHEFGGDILEALQISALHPGYSCYFDVHVFVYLSVCVECRVAILLRWSSDVMMHDNQLSLAEGVVMLQQSFTSDI